MLTSTLTDSERTQNNLLSVVIPVYNCEDTVSRSLQRIGSVLSSISSNYEIIVVNDGSKDKTLEVLQIEQLSNAHLKIITYPDNMGKGYAVKKGVINSHGDVVVFTDGDLDISPNIIGQYIQQLRDCDLVIASKAHPHSVVNARMSRRILSRLFNFIVRVIVGIKVADTQAGMKAGRGDVLRKTFGIMLVKRYAFDVELLTIATMLKKNIREMPIEITLDKRFKIKEMVKMFLDVLAIGYRLRISRWYRRMLAATG